MRKRLALLLAVLLAVALIISACGQKQAAEKESAITVNVVKVAKLDVARNVKYAGQVRGTREIYITPKVTARVTGVLVKAGDSVSPGQTLLTLDPGDYEAAVRIAQAGVASAEAGKRSADSQLETARASYERSKTLHDTGAISDQALEQARSAYEVLAAGSAEAALELARANLAQAQANLDRCILTSTINGTVGTVALSLGDNSSTQNPAVIVTDNSQLEVSVLVSESDVNYIKAGQEVAVSIKAASGQPFKGTVQSISTVPDPQRKNYPVKVILNNEEGKIKSGMFAEIAIDTESKKAVLSLPVNAVSPKGGRQLVYLVGEDSRVKEVEVEIGLKNDLNVEIMKGLAEGQTIVSKGNTLLHDGSLVKVVSGGASE
ncbi:MAG TPA: efflux RND transporter periplasmic adaptor subunit [Syntrophomonadaceae bacterium]|nr:efflux RND transporter periplasmic adaptor subunit [Syntrophomonadaceae bacterium]